MAVELIEGMQAPDFSLKDHEGGVFSLSSQRGRYVVLFFYSENDTPICTTHACSMQEVHRELGGDGVKVVGVSPDPIDSHRAFRSKYSLGYTLLSDPEKKVFELYNAWGEKNSYGRIIQGLLRSSFIIDPDGTIVKVFRRLNTKANAGQLLQAYRNVAKA